MGYGRSFDMGVFGTHSGHAVTENLPVLASQSVQAVNSNPAATNNNIPAFTLDAGPPIFLFSPPCPATACCRWQDRPVTSNRIFGQPSSGYQRSMRGT